MPALIRLLKPGEMRAGRRGAPPEAVKEGRYVTDGFGLYPTIVNPPYTTLTAYDLNSGTIKWQIGLGDDLRLVGQGVTGTGTAALILLLARRPRASAAALGVTGAYAGAGAFLSRDVECRAVIG